MAWKEICALSLIAIAIMLALPTVSASINSLSDLKSSISGFEDPRMGTEDLAFYLASHGFDATPKGGLVEVDLGGHVYRLIPNGSAPGLASIAA
jgi:hydrogenase/urease accessory protein HupE